jgi:hypothetical protein
MNSDMKNIGDGTRPGYGEESTGPGTKGNFSFMSPQDIDTWGRDPVTRRQLPADELQKRKLAFCNAYGIPLDSALFSSIREMGDSVNSENPVHFSNFPEFVSNVAQRVVHSSAYPGILFTSICKNFLQKYVECFLSGICLTVNIPASLHDSPETIRKSVSEVVQRMSKFATSGALSKLASLAGDENRIILTGQYPLSKCLVAVSRRALLDVDSDTPSADTDTPSGSQQGDGTKYATLDLDNPDFNALFAELGIDGEKLAIGVQHPTSEDVAKNMRFGESTEFKHLLANPFIYDIPISPDISATPESCAAVFKKFNDEFGITIPAAMFGTEAGNLVQIGRWQYASRGVPAIPGKVQSFLYRLSKFPGETYAAIGHAVNDRHGADILIKYVEKNFAYFRTVESHVSRDIQNSPELIQMKLNEAKCEIDNLKLLSANSRDRIIFVDGSMFIQREADGKITGAMHA